MVLSRDRTLGWRGGTVSKCIKVYQVYFNKRKLLTSGDQKSEVSNLKILDKKATFLSGYKSYIFICIFERDYIETKFESISFSEKQEKSTPIDRLINVCELADHTARFPPQMVHVVAGVSK